MGEAPIFHFNDERESIVEEVVGRVVRGAKDPLLLLNDAAYHECKRLEAHPGGERAEYQRFRDIARTVGRMSEGERVSRLEDVSRRYARDVAGNFNPRVFALSTKVLPRALTLLLAPTLGDAAEAVREFHDVRARVTAGDAAGSVLWRRATGGEGHPAALAAGSCEAGVLRGWIEGRPTRGCAGR